jgi:ABC-type lipoprotein release transport system permease subunit
MIVWERTREIGTLRALGMQRRRAVSSFLAEAGFLGFAGFLGGLLLGIAVLEITRLAFSFPPNIITTLFFTRGRLSWVMPVWSVLAIAALVVGASVLGSLRASMRAGKMSPVTAMSHQTK